LRCTGISASSVRRVSIGGRHLRHPHPSDVEVLEQAAAVLRTAARRRAAREAAAVAAGFLVLLVATALSAVLHPAAPLLVLASGVVLAVPVVSHLSSDPGDPTPPPEELLGP
jgi:hypothetical protein